MDDVLLSAIRAHAEREAPRECCGLIVRIDDTDVYAPCRNAATVEAEFAIAPEDWARAEDRGTVRMVVHSHVGLPPAPSQADRVQIERTRLPWLIVNHPTGAHSITAPSGYVAPLEGREFAHGVLDCYALIRDYYRERLGLELRDYPREWEWWDRGQNLYLAHFDAEGFMRVYDAPRRHDVILMQIRASVPNHAGVYLGEQRMLHHLMGQLSREEVYGGFWQKTTAAVLRHRSLT